MSLFTYVGSQNHSTQAPKRRRNRGLAGFIKQNELVDITNHQPSKRHFMEKAEQCMSMHHCKPRGDPVGGGKTRWSKCSPTNPPNNPQSEVDKPVDTLKRILTHDKDTFTQGFDLINTYMNEIFLMKC